MERAGFNYRTLFPMHNILREWEVLFNPCVLEVLFKPCLLEAMTCKCTARLMSGRRLKPARKSRKAVRKEEYIFQQYIFFDALCREGMHERETKIKLLRRIHGRCIPSVRKSPCSLERWIWIIWALRECNGSLLSCFCWGFPKKKPVTHSTQCET